MILQRFHKREFLIGELEILVPNSLSGVRIEGLAADAGYWNFANRFGMNAGYRMTYLQQGEFHPVQFTARQKPQNFGREVFRILKQEGVACDWVQDKLGLWRGRRSNLQ